MDGAARRAVGRTTGDNRSAVEEAGAAGEGWVGARAPPATSELQAAPKHAMALLAAARDTNMSPFAVLPCHR